MDTWFRDDEPDKATSSNNCPRCNGVGFVYINVPPGHTDFGKVVPCHCLKKESTPDYHDRLRRYSNIGPLTRFTFDNLVPQGRSGDLVSQQQFQRAYDAARAYAHKPQGWLVLVGPSGSGKTHIGAAITNESIAQGSPAFFISTPDLLDRLRQAFRPDSELPYDQFFDQVRNAPLLVLDDLGVQSSTSWAKEKLDQLLTHRFNTVQPTVVISIVPLSQLEDRIRTRLTDPDLCQVYSLDEKAMVSEYGWSPEFALQQSMTFTNFDYKRVNLPLEQRQNLEIAYRLAMDYAKTTEGWLVFMGTTGCGKTHLAAAIVNYRYQAQKPALFVVVPEFLDHLRSTFNPDSQMSYDQLFERVKKAELLVLDDFGEQSTTPWAREKLYQVINYRYNARLAMVITTRLSLQEILEEIESSISSRLVDHKFSTPFNIMAPDYRGDLRPTKTRYRRTRKWA